MHILDNFDTDINFWEMNPQLKYMDVFNTLWKSDKSTKKKESSQIMWAIALLLDRSRNNKFRNMPEEEKKEQLAKYFLNKPDFDWGSPKITKLIDQYTKCMLSQAMRSLLNWEEKMKERDEFIKNTPYNMETYAGLDKMLTAYSSMFTLYKQISDTLQLEDETDDASKNKYIKEI